MERKLPEGWKRESLLKAVGGESSLIVGGPFGSNLKVSDYEQQGVPIIRLQNINWNRFVDKDIKFISEQKAKDLSYHSFQSGDIAIAKLGDPIGKSCIIPSKFPTGIVVADVVRVRNSNPNLDTRYLVGVLNSANVANQLNKKVCGTTRPRVNLDDIRDVFIPIPPLETQQKIVVILDKAEETKRLRAQSNELTQKLLQSVFLEMFGDPIKNEKGWLLSNLSELASGKGSISCGPFGSQLKIGEYVENGLPVLGIDNIEKDEFVWAKSKQITHEKAEQLSQFRVNPGDLLISRTGTVGRACIVPEDLCNAIIGPNLLKIRFDKSKMEPEYFSMAINFIPSVINEIVKISPGATVAVLNTTNLKKLKIVVPDIAVQRNFIAIKKRIEKIRIFQREMFEQVNPLLNDLVNKAFSGELIA